MANITTLTVSHPNSLNVIDILGLVEGIVQADAPAVVSSLPISATHQGTAMSWIGLVELGLAIVTQISQAIAAAHAAKNPPAA